MFAIIAKCDKHLLIAYSSIGFELIISGAETVDFESIRLSTKAQ